MSRNRNNIPITIDDTDETLTKGITFNYSENFNRVIELSTENYPSWRTNILYLLMINNLEGYVIEEKIKKLRKRNLRDDLDNYLEDKFDPSLVYDKNTSLKDIKNDVMVKWIITNSLGENTKKIIEGNGKTAHQIWITLEKSFTMSPEKRKLEIKSKINNLKYNEEDDINIFIAKLQNAIDELENIDYELSDPVKAGILNRSLPENLRFINVFQYKNDWKQLCNYVKDVIPDIIFSNTREISKTEENKLFLVESQAKNRNKISKVITTRKRKNGKCFNCGTFGHYSYECRNKAKYRFKRKPFKKNLRKNYCNNIPSTSKYIRNQRKNQVNAIEKPQGIFEDYNTENGILLNCITNTVSNNHYPQSHISQWIIDSGASIHITGCIDLLTDIKKCNEEVILPNGKTVVASAYGNFTGYIENSKFILKNVFYVDSINKNIISVTKLIQQHYKIIFFNYNNKPYLTIYNDSGKRIINVSSNSQNIFTLWLSNKLISNNEPKHDKTLLMHLSTLNKLDKINLWHRRLGHFNINPIKNKLLKINIKSKCPICSQSKQRNLPHRKSNNRAKAPFELIHMDLVGPVVESIHYNKYFLSILDDYTLFGWVLFILNKSDVFEKFPFWVKSNENIFNKTITYIRTDNGTEFMNN